MVFNGWINKCNLSKKKKRIKCPSVNLIALDINCSIRGKLSPTTEMMAYFEALSWIEDRQAHRLLK